LLGDLRRREELKVNHRRPREWSFVAAITRRFVPIEHCNRLLQPRPEFADDVVSPTVEEVKLRSQRDAEGGCPRLEMTTLLRLAAAIRVSLAVDRPYSAWGSRRTKRSLAQFFDWYCDGPGCLDSFRGRIS
jgi:hypothetical protein